LYFLFLKKIFFWISFGWSEEPIIPSGMDSNVVSTLSIDEHRSRYWWVVGVGLSVRFRSTLCWLGLVSRVGLFRVPELSLKGLGGPRFERQKKKPSWFWWVFFVETVKGRQAHYFCLARNGETKVGGGWSGKGLDEVFFVSWVSGLSCNLIGGGIRVWSLTRNEIGKNGSKLWVRNE